MLITNDVLKNRYTGDGLVTQFPLAFPFFDGKHVAVFTSEPGLPVVRVSPSSYTIAGAGNPAGGTCTFKIAPPAGLSIALVRDVPITQLHKYTELDNFPAESHEDALAKLTMICQQLTEEVGRTIKVPVTSDDPPELLAELIFEARDQAIESAAEALVSETNAAASAAESAALLEEVKTEHTTSLEDIENARTGALTNIESGRTGALANISEARSAAIGAIVSQETDSTLAVNQAGQQQVSAVNSAASNALAAAQQQLTGIITEGDTQVQRVKSAGNQARIEVTAEGDVQVQRVSGSANQALVEIKASTIEAAQSAEQAEMYAQQAKDLTGYELASATNIGIGLKLGNGLERVGDVMNVIGMTILSTPVLEFPILVAIGHKYVLTMSSTTGIPGAAIQGFTVTVDRRDPVVVLSEPGGTASYEITVDGLDLEDGEIVVTATDSVGNDSKQARHAYSKRAVTIVAPRVLSPLDGDIDVPLKPEVTVGAFTAIGMPDTPASTRLLVYKGDEVVYDTGHIGYFTSHKVTTELPDFKDLTFAAEHAGNIYGKSGVGPAVVATTIRKGILPATILSPPNGAMDQAVNVVVALSAIKVTGIDASPAGTKVIVYRDEELTTPVFTYDGAYTLTVPTAGLPVKTELWVTGAHKDGVLGWASMSPPVHFTTLNAAVNKPVVLSPVAGSVTEHLSVTVTLSEFSNVGPIDSPKATDIRIVNMIGEVVARYTGAYTTTHTFDASLFAINTDYIVDAEHEGNTWGKSQRSDPVAFKTVDAAVLAPEILSPTEGQTGVLLTPTIKLSAFANVGPEDTPKATHIRIYAVGNTVDVVQEYSGPYTTSWVVPAALALESRFVVFAEHEGTLWGKSATSPGRNFVTTNAYIEAPVIITPLPNGQLRTANATVVCSPAVTVGCSHASTDWKLTSDEAGTNVLAQAPGSSDKLAHQWLLGWNVSASTYSGKGLVGGIFANDVWLLFCAERTLRSTEGTTWETCPTAGPDVKTACYGQGVFVACSIGAYTTRHSGDNGRTWAASNVTDVRLNGICFGHDTFVAVGAAGKCVTSESGTLWGASFVIGNRTDIVWHRVQFGNDLFVAIGSMSNGSECFYATSENGKLWTAPENVGTITQTPKDLHFADGKFVLIGMSGRVAFSTSGSGWSQPSIIGATGDYSIRYGNGVWVAPASSAICVSTDLITWKQEYIEPANSSWLACVYGKGRFVCGGSHPNIAIRDAFIPPETPVYCHATFNADIPAIASPPALPVKATVKESLFVLAGDSGYTQTSVDCKTWTKVKTPVPAADIHAIIHACGEFMAVGGSLSGNFIAKSFDGLEWQTPVSASGHDSPWLAVCRGADKYVVAGWGGRVSTSYDGATWTPAYTIPGFGAIITGIAYGNGRYVAIGGGRTVTSADGDTWEPYIYNPDVEGECITYFDGKFVVGGFARKLSKAATTTSVDGTTWTPGVVDSTGVSRWVAGTSVMGKVALVGHVIDPSSRKYTGAVAASIDGSTWGQQARQVAPNDLIWEGIAYGNNIILLAGSNYRAIGDQNLVFGSTIDVFDGTGVAKVRARCMAYG